MPELLAVDSETHRIREGVLAPRPVVWSFADAAQSWMARGREGFEQLHGAARPGVTWAMSNAPFDAAVAGGRDFELLKLLFDKYERGEIHDVEVAATLDAIAEGRVLEGCILDRDGQPLRQSGSNKTTNRIRLENAVKLYLGRDDAKVNDEYRTKYGELEELPTELWPPEARQYPLDDARNQYDVAVVQRRVCKNIGPIGINGVDYLPTIRHTHLTHNVRAHLVMHLGSVYGIRTDPKRIAELEADIRKVRLAGDRKFRDLNFIKTEAPPIDPATGQPKLKRDGTPADTDDGKDNGCEVKRRVIVAFGGSVDEKCPKCSPYVNDERYGLGRGPFGKPPKPTKRNPNPVGGAVGCKECNATGLAVPPQVPRTDAGGVCADRDILKDSGDDDLVAWAEYGEHDKLELTYLPWLRTGINAPINVKANVLGAVTARSSYEGLIQLIPPLARECIIAPPGYAFCSIDLAAGELCTLAQVHLWLFGHSSMADAINSSGDPGALHSIFGANLAGITDQPGIKAFIAATKDKKSREAGLRQLAKVGNFGFPGMMGPAKLVISARRKGDRLCVISGMNKKCRKGVMVWNDRELDRPTCPDCLEVAANLKQKYLATWEEMPEYFDWVKSIDGVGDGTGTIVSPGTGFIRGGVNPSAAANHPFQHLLAMAKKQALWLVGKEAYTDESSPLFGTKVIGDIHDELLTLIPITDHMHEAAFRKKQLIIQGVQQFTPGVIAVADDPCFMPRWYKKACAVYDVPVHCPNCAGKGKKKDSQLKGEAKHKCGWKAVNPRLALWTPELVKDMEGDW